MTLQPLQDGDSQWKGSSRRRGNSHGIASGIWWPTVRACSFYWLPRQPYHVWLCEFFSRFTWCTWALAWQAICCIGHGYGRLLHLPRISGSLSRSKWTFKPTHYYCASTADYREGCPRTPSWGACTHANHVLGAHNSLPGKYGVELNHAWLWMCFVAEKHTSDVIQLFVKLPLLVSPKSCVWASMFSVCASYSVQLSFQPHLASSFQTCIALLIW